MDIIVGRLFEPKSAIKIGTCHETSVKDDFSDMKLQAESVSELTLTEFSMLLQERRLWIRCEYV